MLELNIITINDNEFELISKLVYDQFGIKLTEKKKALVIGRLQKVLKKLGFHKFSDYYNYVINDSSKLAISELINQISTNYTYFYREGKHFDFFLKVALPEIIEKLKKSRSNDIRIWCAGCSSGEEAYTLAMLLMEYLDKDYRFWNAGILATDISEKALNVAKEGIYTTNEISSLPKTYIQKYFKRLNEDKWEVSEKLRKEVTFRRFNLMNNVYPFKGEFHIVFCRNVLIYFDSITRTKIIGNIHQFLIPNGYLFIGHSESLGREQNLFKYLLPAVYKKN